MDAKNKKKLCYVLMTGLVCIWGLDYIVAKNALDVFQPITLVFFKYCMGFVLLMSIKLVKERRFPFRLKDLPIFFLCSLTGEILYYYCEYTSITYLPVSLVTIILSFVPMLSIFLEWLVYKVKPSKGMIFGVVVCIIGIVLVIGGDFRELFAGGRFIGYLLAFGAVISWNLYNFLTAGLSTRYESLTLTTYQMICTILLALPFMLNNLPEASLVTPAVISQVLYLGIISAGFGFLIYVTAIGTLGATPCALFSNFLPVTATLFGWVLLGEMITPIQLFGGAIVIASGCYVIRAKEKIEISSESGKAS